MHQLGRRAEVADSQRDRICAPHGSTYYTRDSSGTVLGERNPAGGSGSYYFLFDGLGSIVAVCDATGIVKDTFKYDPYGGSAATTAPVAAPWRFAGGYYDTQTSLYKFGERYYDVALGRWNQLDGLNDPLDTHGWNRYVYVGDDPANQVDPRGTVRRVGFRNSVGAADSVGHHLDSP
jgi:RHS repeat-associated protein